MDKQAKRKQCHMPLCGLSVSVDWISPSVAFPQLISVGDTHAYTHSCVLCVRLLGQRGSSIIYCRRSVFFYPLFSPCGKQNSWPVTFFCWLHRPSVALANGFPATLVPPQNTPWHEWHPKVGNSICQWILHCGTDGRGYVSIISRLSAERFLKAE